MKPGAWIREARTADCPQCHADSVGVRPCGDSEIRQCEQGHHFNAAAWRRAKTADATRFDCAV